MFDGLEYRKLVMEMTEVSAEQKEDVAVKINNGGRIHWVDVCRVLAIFSIVYGHEGFLQNKPFTDEFYISQFFFNTSAPWVTVLMFFFFSGWLQKVRGRFFEWRGFLHFYIPVLIWNIVCLLMCYPLDDNIFYYIERLGFIPWGNANTPLWFLNELAWYTLVLPIILRVPVCMRVCFVLFALWVGDSYSPISFSSSKWANVFACFVAGTLINGVDKSQVNAFIRRYTPIVAIVSIVVLVQQCYFPALFKFPAMRYSAMYVIVGMLTLFGYGVILERLFPRICAYISSHASSVFFIYASHVPMFVLYVQLSVKYNWPEISSTLLPWLAVLYVVVGMLVTSLARATRCRILLRYVFLISLPDKKS
ncbi:MAG: acyltransferase [Akkermansia sp.]|nr:acyltransferase [Akkermansia sp.]